LFVRYEPPVVPEDEVEAISTTQEADIEASLITVSQTAGVTSIVFSLIIADAWYTGGGEREIPMIRISASERDGATALALERAEQGEGQVEQTCERRGVDLEPGVCRVCDSGNLHYLTQDSMGSG
jgi:hypothetical protein